MEETKMEEMSPNQEEEEEEEEEEEAEATIDIWKYILGFAEVAGVKCAIELGIADALESHGRHNPMPLSDLSRAVGCAPPSLHRIMRFLVHRHVFKEIPGIDGGYVRTALSRRLARRGEKSMAALVLLEASPPMMAPWHHLSTCLRADMATLPFQVAHGGKDLWAYTKAHPDHGRLLDEALSCNSRVAVPALVKGCPEVFEGLTSLVDVGGGNGTTIHGLVKAFPWIRGINFDTPDVVCAAPEWEGIQHVGGDMFDCVPKADAALIKWVLHDWSDEKCIQILKKCKEAIPRDKGKLIIAEAMIDEERNKKLKDVILMLDLTLMAQTINGKQRTPKEWEFVLGESGFSRCIFKPHISALLSVIEAYP